MKKSLLLICLLLTLASGANAQNDTRPFSQLKGDYNQVGIVAHVRITSIEFAAPDVHPLYVARSEIIEPFKGKLKRGQPLEIYLHLEEDYDANQLLGEWIVFLESERPVPSGGKGWYQLENSSLRPSKRIVAQMRRIKQVRR